MTIELDIHPREVYTWERFVSEMPKYSIALDGFVDSKTQRDPYGPYANFDHHSGIDRTATRSTSEQVHMEINLGLFNTFKKDGLPHAIVHVNDPDEDTCLAWWLLKHNESVTNHADPLINRLVYCEDRLDCTAGAYPFGDTSMRRKMAWIFEPYNKSRFTGKLAQASSGEMRNIMESVESRITEHILGGGKEISLEGNYEKIGGGEGWAFTKETGPASRMAMYNDGITAFVTHVAQNPDGSNVYALGRRSVWTPFPIPVIYTELNRLERKTITETNKWGGGDTTGGSPKLTGSDFTPSELESIIINKIKNRS